MSVVHEPTEVHVCIHGQCCHLRAWVMSLDLLQLGDVLVVSTLKRNCVKAHLTVSVLTVKGKEVTFPVREIHAATRLRKKGYKRISDSTYLFQPLTIPQSNSLKTRSSNRTLKKCAKEAEV